MSDTHAHDETTREMTPLPPELQQILAKAKRAFRSAIGDEATRAEEAREVDSPTQTAGERTHESPRPPPLEPHLAAKKRAAEEHASWLKGLTEPQRRAYEAYQERGLDIEERELRDVLRAAMSLHPDREVASKVISDLRVPIGPVRESGEYPAGTAARDAEEHEHDATPFTNLLSPDQDASNELAEREAVTRASERVAALAREVRAAKRTHIATYRALGLPELPKNSARRKLLAAAVAPAREQDADGRHGALKALDQQLRAMQRDIIDDPLWIAADYLDRTTALEQVEDRVRDDEGVKRARGEYKKAEERVRSAARALDTYEPPNRWQRTLDMVRGQGKGEQDRLLALHAAMKEASLTLHNAKRGLDDAEREARAAAHELNAQSLEVQREARARRDALEQPLRQALADRYIAERALTRERAPQHLRDASDLGSLTYVGQRTVGGFDYHEFSNFGGATYLADSVELRSTIAQLDLQQGDRVVLRSDELGARHLQLEERADPSRTVGPLPGRPFGPAVTREPNDAHARGR